MIAIIVSATLVRLAPGCATDEQQLGLLGVGHARKRPDLPWHQLASA